MLIAGRVSSGSSQRVRREVCVPHLDFADWTAANSRVYELNYSSLDPGLVEQVAPASMSPNLAMHE